MWWQYCALTPTLFKNTFTTNNTDSTQHGSEKWHTKGWDKIADLTRGRRVSKMNPRAGRRDPMRPREESRVVFVAEGGTLRLFWGPFENEHFLHFASIAHQRAQTPAKFLPMSCSFHTIAFCPSPGGVFTIFDKTHFLPKKSKKAHQKSIFFPTPFFSNQQFNFHDFYRGTMFDKVCIFPFICTPFASKKYHF